MQISQPQFETNPFKFSGLEISLLTENFGFAYQE